MKRHVLRLWRKLKFDLGVVGIAAVLGFAFLVFLSVITTVSAEFGKFGLPSVDTILLIFPEDQAAVMAVGLMVVIGGYSEVSSIRTLMGMASVALGLVVTMAGIVALLLPDQRAECAF